MAAVVLAVVAGWLAGVPLYATGDLDGAVACLAEAARVRPDNPTYRRNFDAVLKEKAARDARRPVAPPPREARR